MIIAVDGPAASGKGTVSKALARHFRLPHLDTALLSRAGAATVRRLDLDPPVEADAVAASDFDELTLADPVLRTGEIGELASVVSAHPLVRRALLQRQKRFAHQPGGAVLDGRDIGTVIAPDADAKLFVRATPQIRARRRHTELQAHGSTLSFDRVLADIRARDARDSGRDAAPLVMAPDAMLLDTSFLSIEASIERAIALAQSRIVQPGR